MGAINDYIAGIAEDIEKRTGKDLFEIMDLITNGFYGDLSFLRSVYEDRTNRKILLFADNFYSDFWMFSTSDPADLIETVKDLENQRQHEIDPTKHKLLYDTSTDGFLCASECRDLCDEVLFNSDFYDD